MDLLGSNSLNIYTISLIRMVEYLVINYINKGSFIYQIEKKPIKSFLIFIV